MKKQPETIADLKINWIFAEYENDSMFAKEARFRTQNKSLLKYKIKRDDYTFLVNDSVFYVHASNSYSSIDSFIEEINFKLAFNSCHLPKKLTRFELVAENTFRIHLEEPTVKN